MRKKSMLFKAVLLVCLVILSGCGSDKTNNSNDKASEENSAKKATKMTVEDTKKLTKGQFIESLDEKTPVTPDEATLEAMGLDFEYVIEASTSVNGGEFTNDEENQYWYHSTKLDVLEAETKEGDKTFHKKYVVKGVNIIPIVYVYEENGSKFKKSELTDKSIAIQKLIDDENFEKINEILINRIS